MVTMDGSREAKRRERKDVVEDCLVLSVRDVRRGAGRRSGSLRWRCGDQVLGLIEYAINLRSAEQGCLWLWYTAAGGANHVAISMASTVLHSGGRRWWFRCPVTGDRVGKLYLPPGATRFAGRQAHDLTYTSCRESGREKGLWRRMAKLSNRRGGAASTPAA